MMSEATVDRSDEDAPEGTVDTLATRFWEDFLERQPIYASMLGDRRFDDRLSDPGATGRAQEVAAFRATLEGADRIDPAGLDVEDRITLNMLRVVCEVGLAQHEQAFHEFSGIDHIDGPQGLPGDIARFHVVDGPEAFERLLTRLAAYPAYLDASVDNIHGGERSGRTAARRVVERTIEQLERSLAEPTRASPLLAGIQGLDDAQREALTAAIERDVQPAQARYLEVLRAHLPSARAEDGLWSMPGGEEAYRTAILASITIEATPEELHEYGRTSLAEIDEERREIARQLGYADPVALRTALECDPRNLATSGEQLVELARAQIARAQEAAPRFFGRLPKQRCEVRPVEPYLERDAPAAFYYPPAADGARPGIYYINTYQPEARPLHQLATITYHEAVPGHHFQCTIETELEALHPFRRYGSRLAGVAYTEGWGLYSERLADEMGLFLGLEERLGMLDMQAMRAARLIVDTGLHAFEWTRDQGVEQLVSAGLTRLQAEIETDRYIVWPGQALSYMTGQREIQSLRRQIAVRDGDRFDLAAFHDALLGHGSLPLATLRDELPGWVAPRS